MIQFMPANHSNTNRVITILIHSDKTHFQNVFVMLLCRVAKDVTSSLLSWYKRYDFNAANFRCHSQWKCTLQCNELECCFQYCCSYIPLVVQYWPPGATETFMVKSIAPGGGLNSPLAERDLPRNIFVVPAKRHIALGPNNLSVVHPSSCALSGICHFSSKPLELEFGEMCSALLFWIFSFQM